MIGQFEAPDLFASAPVKAPFSRPNNSLSIRVVGIAEQLTRTITRFASAQPVNVRRDEFLARASLAEQQHGSVGGRNLICLFQGAPDGGALSDHDLVTEALPGFASQVQVLRLQSLADDCGLQGSKLEGDSAPLLR